MKTKGYTLVELMVVTVMTGLMFAALGTVLMAGIRIWDSVARVHRPQADAFVARLIMERDIRSQTPLHMIPFEGDVESFSFAAVNRVRSGDQRFERIEHVRWWLDGDELYRSAQIYPDESEAREELLLSGVSEGRFEYVSRAADLATNDVSRVDGVIDEALGRPDAVRVRLDFGDAGVVEREIGL